MKEEIINILYEYSKDSIDDCITSLFFEEIAERIILLTKEK